MGAGLTSGLTGISQEDLTIWSGPYVVILIWWYLGLTSPLQHGPHQFLEKTGAIGLAISQLVRITGQDSAAAQC